MPHEGKFQLGFCQSIRSGGILQEHHKIHITHKNNVRLARKADLPLPKG
jgi:hypothetical protein